jgi:hypothetical protein
MSRADYEKHATEIENIPIEDRRYLVPIANAVQEAENLYEIALHDKDALSRAGLDLALVESLPSRAGALRYAHSAWNAARFPDPEVQRQYESLLEEGYALRDEIVHHLFFAFRHDQVLVRRVQNITEGTGDADMVQDISDLHALGIANPALLRAIGVELSVLERARDLSSTISHQVAGSRAAPPVDEARTRRDRAYVFVKTAVDEIRTTGRYVFWRDAERARLYASEYIRRRNRARRRDETNEGDAPLPVPVNP